MKQANALPWRHLVLFVRMWFGAHLMYSGLAYVLTGWTPTVMATGATPAGTIMAVLAGAGLYAPVKYVELIVGLMLVSNVAVPLALVIELPLTLFISYLNIVVEGVDRQLFTGPQELFLNISLLFAYGGYYAHFLCLRARPWWLWDGFAGPAPQVQPSMPLAPVKHSRPLQTSDACFIWIIIAVLVLAVLSASQLLGPPERRLPPRDYVPLIVAVIAVVATMLRERRQAK
jgi:hypothetical protein